MPASEYASLLESISRPGGLSPENLLAMAKRCTQECRECGLWEGATTTILGSGPASARFMVVNGQAGFEDETGGRAFLGPGRAALDEALQRAGIGIPDVYITDAVKHICRPVGCAGPADSASAEATVAGVVEPSSTQIAACRRWLSAEMAVVKPEVVMCLGRTAARAVLGNDVDLPRERGKTFHPGFVPTVIVTVHPSTIANQPDEEARAEAAKRFLLEVQRVAEILGEFDPFRGREALAQL